MKMFLQTDQAVQKSAAEEEYPLGPRTSLMISWGFSLAPGPENLSVVLTGSFKPRFGKNKEGLTYVMLKDLCNTSTGC